MGNVQFNQNDLEYALEWRFPDAEVCLTTFISSFKRATDAVVLCRMCGKLPGKTRAVSGQMLIVHNLW